MPGRSEQEGAWAVTWLQAFPEWHLVETETLHPERVVALTSPEERLSAILEVASYFRGSVEFPLGRLYPLVPSLFPVALDTGQKPVPFSALAPLPAVDALRNSNRRTIRRLHHTLAQANAAAAVVGTEQWPDDPIVGTLAAALFALDPIDFYLVTHVGIGRRSPEHATEFLEATADISDIPEYLETVNTSTFASIGNDDLAEWLAPLLDNVDAIDVTAKAQSHPQLLARLPLLDYTFSEAIGYLLPGWELRDGSLVRTTPGQSPTIDNADRALALAACYPGIRTSQIATALDARPVDIENALATRGLAYQRTAQSRPAEHAWSITTWRRLGIHNDTQATDLLESSGLTPRDLDLPDLVWTVAGTERDLAESPTEAAELDDDQLDTPTGSLVGEQPPLIPVDELPADTSPTTADETAESGAERDDEQPVADDDARRLVDSESLHDWERVLAERLSGAVLVAEADLSPAELEQLFIVYGRRFKLARGRYTKAEQFTRKFPATTLGVLVGAASTEFENNTFWSEFFEAIGVEQNSPDENAFRQGIPDLLKRFDLDRLPHIPKSGYVERLTVHAGVPASSFGELVDALTTYVALVDNREDRPFREWILEPSHEQLFRSLNAPARTFIAKGGDKASEFLDILTDIVAQVASDPSLNGADVALAHSGELPTLILSALSDAFQSNDVGEQVRRRRRQSGETPTLALGSDDSVILHFPAPAGHADKPWAVTLDSEVRQVSPDRLDRHGAVDITLDKPTRRAVVSHPSFNKQIEMRLFDPERPIIAFTSTGNHIATSTRLPRAEIAVLLPKEYAVRQSPDTDPIVRGEFPAPMGWSGWKIESWDLTGESAVHVSDPRSVGVHKQLPSLDLDVGKRDVPELDFSDGEALPIPGLSHRGLPVFGAERPWVILPALRSGDRVGWTVEYRRSGTSAWIRQGEYFTEALESYELFADEGPLFGSYEVRVTGPDGARFDTELFLADGLRVEFDEDFRIPDGAEMTPISAQVSTEDSPLRALNEEITFPASVSHRDLKLRLGDRIESVRIRPPRLEFRLTPIRAIPVWSDRRISRHPRDLLRADLAIRGVPEDVIVDVEVRDSAGRTRHRQQPRHSRDGTTRTLIAASFADAAERAQFGELVAVLRYPGGDSYEAPLIRFSVLGHNYRVELDGNQIVVAGLSTTESVACHVWQLERPWVPPIVESVSGGVAVLPSSVENTGSLRVDVQVSDDWDPVPPDYLPGRNSVRLERTGRHSGSNQGLLSQFLSGETAMPQFGADLPEIWTALALLDRELDPEDRARYEYIADVVTGSPRTAARSLAEANLPNSEKLAQFTGTGLVLSSLKSSPSQLATHERVAEPWLDMLLSIADIPFAARTERLSELDRIEEIGGTSLRTILATGHDPLIGTALDAGAVKASDDSDFLRNWLTEQSLVPGRLVDEASRLDGFFELLDHKDSLPKDIVNEWYRLAMQEDFGAITYVRRHTTLNPNVETRFESLGNVDPVAKPWASVTYVSLAFAIYARLLASGATTPAPKQYIRSVRRAWSAFARLQPLETTIDIVIADALVAHYDYAKRGFAPFGYPDGEVDVLDTIITN